MHENLFLNKKRFDREKPRHKPENPEEFLGKYGIKYCSFHRGALVEEIVGITHLIVDNVKYDFGIVRCEESCKTPVSFDEELIEIIMRNGEPIEVRINDGLDECMVCREVLGKSYLVGFRSPCMGIDKSNGRDGMPIYVAKKDCGHEYAFMKI